MAVVSPVMSGRFVFRHVPFFGVVMVTSGAPGAARLTVTVYVAVVVPSAAVMTTGIGLLPTVRPVTSCAVPFVALVPLMVMVALASDVVAVRLILSVLNGTLTV
nr:hypothetical protein [Evansella tamaricis]